MRIKLLHHASEWLPDDVEPPTPLARRAELNSFRAHRSADKGLLAARVHRGAAIWDGAGKLLHYDEKAADLHFGRKRKEVLALENVFGRCATGAGIKHRIKRLEAGTFRTLSESDLCVPMGGVEYLIVDHREATALATWLDQQQWGYVTIDLASLQQMAASLAAPGPTLSPPAYSPNDELVVACHYYRSRWWTDGDDWHSPSPGGPHRCGTISVHTMATDRVSFHEVWVDLPPGWLPDRPEEADWSNIWGPEFVADHAFKFWLPDDTEETLTLPLPARIDIRRPLSTTRPWDDG